MCFTSTGRPSDMAVQAKSKIQALLERGGLSEGASASNQRAVAYYDSSASAVPGPRMGSAASDAVAYQEGACAVMRQGKAHLLLGEHDQAIQQFNRVLSDYSGLEAENVEALRMVGECQRKAGQYDAAIATLERVLKDYHQCDSDCAEALLIAGKCCQLQRDQAGAIKCFRRDPTALPDYAGPCSAGSPATSRNTRHGFESVRGRTGESPGRHTNL